MRIGYFKTLVLFILVFGSINIYAQTGIQALEQKLEKLTGTNQKIDLANVHTQLGNLYWQKSEFDKAALHFTKAIEINSELNNSNAIRIINGYLGLIYLEAENYNKAIEYFNNSLSLNKVKNKKQEIISDYYNIASAYQYLNNFEESNKNAKEALSLALELDKLEMAKSCHLLLAENYEKLGDSKKSSEHFTNYSTITKHIQSLQMQQLKTEKQQIEQRISKKTKELNKALDTLDEVVQQNIEIEKQKEAIEELSKAQQKEFEMHDKLRKTQLFYAGLVLILLAALLFLFLIQNQAKKKANKKLQEQNNEIEEQKKEIEKQRDLADKQHEKLTASIQYARKIQSAVIPNAAIIHEHFNDSFISYHPRDIVSGDFYWFVQKENLFILAAADCTGHGVPGAFMSMLGVAYLNEIINKAAVNVHISTLNADNILNQLRDKVISSLHQTEKKGEPKDGMDIALCIIDTEQKTLEFAGAYNPALIIRKNEIIELKGDKMPVSFHKRKDIPFSKQSLKLEAGDCIYLFSDGFIDQFGGPYKRKFLIKNFKELLLNIYQRPMQEQKTMIEQEFSSWKGNLPQVDDVLVMGIRFGKLDKKQEINWSDKTILIAEDTDMNYFLLVEVLKKTKVKTIWVKNGQEAVDYVAQNKVDLILMDINMPVMNGFEATKKIKTSDPNIPILMQTAINHDAFEQAKESGADDFIPKPIDFKTFIEKITKLI